MKLEDAFNKALEGEEVYILCSNEREQESLRVSAFHLRRKLGRFAENISATKVSDGDKLFVKIYPRENLSIFVKKDGKLVEVRSTARDARMIEKMRDDGWSDEDIEAFFAGKEDENESEEGV